MHLVGPFTEIVTCAGWPLRGPLGDEIIQPIRNAGVLLKNGIILAVDRFTDLQKKASTVENINGPSVLLPGFIDAHTHICWAGSRANDYAGRIQGLSYLEIADRGGGIWQTVEDTRAATESELNHLLLERLYRLKKSGTTTVEVKSGYGLEPSSELRILRLINKANRQSDLDLIATCLAAHIKPQDWHGDNASYLDSLVGQLLPVVKREGLANRIDIFVDEVAFSKHEANPYLRAARNLDFAVTVHADQFSTGGSALGCAWKALSVDHLEASTVEEINRLGNSSTVATVLPAASLGLGTNFAPARGLLDAGAILAIASDWNPGSAPMG
ncbi:MAG: imidazolonepropionase, partial [Saprospiraceae bacterium]|nr:imidazolonepropionase [Saprospiraceae bacterium]